MAKPTAADLPIAVQTLYADLVERAWSGDLGRLLEGRGGSPYRREVRGRSYWYWQPATLPDGSRPAALYLGLDSEAVRSRIAALQAEVASLAERRDIVRALVAARLPSPDRLSGNVLAALAEAGVFRLRAAVVGAVAFQSYPGLLGVRLPATLSRTADLDVAQFHSVAVAVEDEVPAALADILKRVDSRFEAIPDPMDSRKVLRYAIRQGGEQLFALDVLSPLRGPERGRLTWLKALRSHAQLLRFLDFLLFQEVNAVALHGSGIPINVPAPERYALHKLLVAQLRYDSAQSQAKARKDLDQATALVEALRRLRPDHLEDIWLELLERGPSWRRKAFRSLAVLPEGPRTFLLEATPGPYRPGLSSSAGRHGMGPLTSA